MYEMDRTQFGTFITELRKQKEMTQKELAQRLFISDKAVSKWERGLSMPDISLLIPLSEILGVTVTELLEGQIIEKSQEIDVDDVEKLVKRALQFSEESPEKKRKRKYESICIGIGTLILLGIEIAVLYAMGYSGMDFLAYNVVTMEILSIVFGIYFLFCAKEKLPVYYDENKISGYSDGFFRMNLPGVSINNSNWPHILQAGRIWSVVSALTYPLIFMATSRLSQTASMVIGYVVLAFYLGGLFIPLYIAARKYE